jgi:hypothetical protein
MSLPSPAATPTSAQPSTAKFHDGLDKPQSPLHRAAAGSRTPFSTLVAIASAESGFDADARVRRSSASGAFQFTEQTWLQLVKRHGASQGRADLAAAITIGDDGVASVAPENRAAVLDARRDVKLSSAIAAKLCDENRATLARKLGRAPAETEVRMAYFLGAGGAARLIQAAETTPQASVKSLLSPRAYANHKSMFVAGGKPLSAGEVVANLTQRFARDIAHAQRPSVQAQANSLLTAQQMAQAAKLNEIRPAAGIASKPSLPDLIGQSSLDAPVKPGHDVVEKKALDCTDTQGGVNCKL